MIRAAVTWLAAAVVFLLPGSSILAAGIGLALVWRDRRRHRAERDHWLAKTREQQLDEILPADWRTRTRENTFPDRLM